MKITDVRELEKKANEVRQGIIEAVYSAKSGHPGGSLSLADILTALYFYQMDINPEEPKNKNRDRLVLSKGHCTPCLYSTLAHRGFFGIEELKNFRKLGSMLQGHPDMNKVPGVDMTTGSLGQGLSAANGMAFAGKLDKLEYKVYCIVGDGEIQEGQIWEAAMSASKYNLNNLCLIIDNNNLQIDGTIEEVKGLKNIKEKFESFGFNVINIDGNNMKEIVAALTSVKENKDKPTAIIAKTVKGKGVSFMENNASWHGKAPNEEEYKKAMKELKEDFKE